MIMREIQTRDEIEKRENKNKTRIGMVLAILLLFSTVGYSLLNRDATSSSSSSSNNVQSNPTGQVVEFKNIKFEAQDSGLWKFDLQGAQTSFYTSYTPQDVANINLPAITLQELANQPLYYSGNTLFVSEIYTNIQPYVERVQEACLAGSEEECDENLPVKDCTSNFIVIRGPLGNSSSSPRVVKDNKCIIVNAGESQILKTADALLFRILGIN